MIYEYDFAKLGWWGCFMYVETAQESQIDAQIQSQAQEPKLVASMQGNMFMARNPKFGFRIRKA